MHCAMHMYRAPWAHTKCCMHIDPNLNYMQTGRHNQTRQYSYRHPMPVNISQLHTKISDMYLCDVLSLVAERKQMTPAHLDENE